MADIAIAFFEGSDINRNLYHGTDIVVSFGRVFVNIIAVSSVILNRVCDYFFIGGVIPCLDRASGAIHDLTEDIKSGRLNRLGRYRDLAYPGTWICWGWLRNSGTGVVSNLS